MSAAVWSTSFRAAAELLCVENGAGGWCSDELDVATDAPEFVDARRWASAFPGPFEAEDDPDAERSGCGGAKEPDERGDFGRGLLLCEMEELAPDARALVVRFVEVERRIADVRLSLLRGLTGAARDEDDVRGARWGCVLECKASR